MICTDKLTEGIKRSSCPQDTLRGFTGSIIIQDWRGYNRFNPNDNYKDYVEIEAERYSIKPSVESEKRDDDLVWFTHEVPFWIKNNSDQAMEKLTGFTNIPLIVSLEKQDGEYLTFFEDTGAKLNINTEYHSGTNGFVAVNCQHFHRNVKEKLGPVRETLFWNVNFTVLDSSTLNPIEGAEIVAYNETVTTDVNGEATVRLIDGSYSYTVNHPDYYEYSDTLTVNGADQDITVNMTTLSVYLLQFKVEDSATLERIQGASVTVDGEGTKTTDINGVASWDLQEGTYSWLVEATGYESESGTYTLTSGSTIYVRLTSI